MKIRLCLLGLLGVVCLLSGCAWFGQGKHADDHWQHNTQPLPPHVYQNGGSDYTHSTSTNEPSRSKPVYYRSDAAGSGGGEYQSRTDEVPSTTAVSKRHKSERNEMQQQINQTLGK